jgi:DNA-binding LacI/PurR family transcriptional regulator
MSQDGTVNRRPRQTDIARHAGVSVSTVSRVLANEPGISDGVRQQIFRIASELGYRVRVAPTQLQPNQSTIALISIDQATGGLSVFYEGILDGLRNAAARIGGSLLTRLVRPSSLTAGQLERHLSDSAAAGVFLVGIDPSEEISRWLEETRTPVVWVNGNDPTMRFDCVSPANFYGAQLATRHLLAAGHRRLLHFSNSDRHTIRERIRGFQTAVASAEGAVGRVVRLPSYFTSATSREAMEGVLAEGGGFTAAFCMNDMIAVGVMEALAAHGVSVPDDFAVLGFDDLPCASMTAPRLSTMRVDREALGREAYRLMQRRIEEPTGQARRIELAVRLVPGGTVSTVVTELEPVDSPA